MQSSSASLLILLWTTLLAIAASQPHHHQQQQHQQALKDVKKLQAGFWLKVAAKQTRNGDEDAACHKDYGQPYLDRWRKLQGTYCNSSSSTTAAASSHVQCYAHPEADLSTCFARDLVLTSTTAFTGSTLHSSELPQPRPGSIHLSCNRTTDPSRFLRGRLQSNEGSRAWLVTAPAFGPASAKLQAACSGPQAVAHPVLFVLRVDPQNAFHHLETVVSVFSALAVLQLDPHHLTHGLEVVIADDRQAGYFLHIWRRLSWPHPLRVLRAQPFPDNACFSKAILAPYAAHAQSLLTYKAGSVDEVLCESVVLQATSRWLRHLFRDLLPLSQRVGRLAGARRPKPASTQPDQVEGHGAAAAVPRDDDSSSRGSGSGSGGFSSQHARLPGFLRELAPLEPSPTQSAAPLELLHVVWLSRHRFEQQHLSELTDWQKARVLSQQQQEELVLALQRVVLQWNAGTCATAEQKDCQSKHVMFSLQVAEFSETSFFPDQLSLMMRAGVLVGVHGAGLANQVYMQPRAGAVVEVWYGMEANTHYHNMAHMLGHAYFNVKCEEGQLDVGAVAGKVTAAMDEAARRHAAAGAAAAASRKSWWWHKWDGADSTAGV